MQRPQGFVAIGSGIYIGLASRATVAHRPDDSAPNVILIFGWIGALTRHLRHYSRKYSELYPQATQIIVKCGPSFAWTPERARQNQLLPVLEALESLGCLPAVNDSMHDPARVRPRVLIHSFSNGGVIQLTSLGRLLSSKYPSVHTSEHLASALILDSSPSPGDFRTIRLAFSIAIRNRVYRYVALVVVYIIHALRLSLQTVFGIDTLATRYLKFLLRPRLLPWMNSQTPRLYVFSKKDELVPWQAVQRHADAAKRAGLDVHCEVYEESAHVGHMRFDPKRYWASVQDLWKVACRARAIEDTQDAATNA